MKVVIAGATGLIGRSLLPLLDSRGHEPIILTRNPDKIKGRYGNIEIYGWNPLGNQLPTKPFEEIGGFVNLSAEPIDAGRWTKTRKQKIMDSRILGNRYFVNFFSKLKKKPGVFVTSSAVGYYGTRGDDILYENSMPGDDFLATVCRDLESEAVKAENMGIRVVRLRTGVVLSPHGGALKRIKTPFIMGVGGKIGNGGQWFSWIHETDVARIILHCLENPSVNGPLNCTSPEPVINRTFTSTLGKVLQRPTFFTVHPLLLKVLFGDMSQVLLSSIRAVPDKLVRSGFQFDHVGLENTLHACLK